MKKMLLLLFGFTGYIAVAQKMPDYGIHTIHISDTGKLIRAEILPVTSMPAVNPVLEYYWYGSNKIHTSQGGFSGDLLNGRYEEFYKNKNLKNQGSYRKGLKNGVWKHWDVTGNLLSLVTWENGIQEGHFELISADGRQTQSGNYHDNKLDGVIIYNQATDSVKTVTYKKGVMQPKKNSFFKKIKLFKKQKQAATAPTP